MARVTSIISQQPIITLELSSEEAEFIKLLTQNSLRPEEESTEEHQIRSSIFNALHKAGI